MKTFDIDGTLLDYDYIPGASPKFNWNLISSVQGETIAIVTNQGGLPFGVMGAKRKDGRNYPRPIDFVRRVAALIHALRKMNVEIYRIDVCVYHPKAADETINQAVSELDILIEDGFTDLPFVIWQKADERKPSPFMLKTVGATSYYGDSDEDEHAAMAAGIPFVKVERFK